MKEKYGNQEGEAQERDSGYENLFGRRQDAEPKIGGISFATMSSTAKMAYLGVIFAIIAVIFYYGNWTKDYLLNSLYKIICSRGKCL